MKKLLAFVMTLTLIMTMSACGEKRPSEAADPGEKAVAASSSFAGSAAGVGREEHTTLQMNVEGETENIPATLYSGEGYSIYIPDEGWKLDEPGEWEAADNDGVELKVISYAGKTAEEARKAILAEYEEYGFMDLEKGNYLFGTNGEESKTMEVYLTERDRVTFAVHCIYPDEATEGFGARMKAIAESFVMN